MSDAMMLLMVPHTFRVQIFCEEISPKKNPCRDPHNVPKLLKVRDSQDHAPYTRRDVTPSHSRDSAARGKQAGGLGVTGMSRPRRRRREPQFQTQGECH